MYESIKIVYLLFCYNKLHLTLDIYFILILFSLLLNTQLFSDKPCIFIFSCCFLQSFKFFLVWNYCIFCFCLYIIFRCRKIKKCICFFPFYCRVNNEKKAKLSHDLECGCFTLLILIFFINFIYTQFIFITRLLLQKLLLLMTEC